MRTMGIHRGNPTLRVAIGSALRRRLYAGLTPHEGESPDAAAHDPLTQRWTRAFFEHLRRDVLPRMAQVEQIDEGELRYLGVSGLSLWGLAAPHALVLAYDFEDTREQLRERARRWLACLRTRTAPGLASRHWGHPVYGARLDPRSDELDVVWAVPGDWLGALSGEQAPSSQAPCPGRWLPAMARA